MIKGWKQLTKEEREHIGRDAKARSTADWEANVQAQVDWATKMGRPLCPECYAIMRKRGEI